MKISEKLIKDIFDDLNKRYDIQENNIFFLLNINDISLDDNMYEYTDLLGIDNSNVIDKEIVFTFNKNTFKLKIKNDIYFFDYTLDPDINEKNKILDKIAKINILLLDELSNRTLTNVFNMFYNEYKSNIHQYEDIYGFGFVKKSTDDIILNKWKKYYENQLENVIKDIKTNKFKNDTKYIEKIPQKLLMGTNTIFNIISKEILNINKHLSKYNYIIEPVDDNIYDCNIKYFPNDKDKIYENFMLIKDKFNCDSINFNIKFDFYLYPYLPPSIKYLDPPIESNIYIHISNLKLFKPNIWNPTTTIKETIDIFIEIINKYLKFDLEYKEQNTLDLLLLNLGINTGEIDEQNIIDIEYNKINYETETKSSSSNKYWNSGVGYGHSGANEWNISEYIDFQKEKNDKIIDNLKEISNFINIFFENKENKENEGNKEIIIQKTIDSTLFTFIKNTFREISTIEIEENLEIYSNLIPILEILLDNAYIIESIYKNKNDTELSNWDDILKMLFELYDSKMIQKYSSLDTIDNKDFFMKLEKTLFKYNDYYTNYQIKNNFIEQEIDQDNILINIQDMFIESIKEFKYNNYKYKIINHKFYSNIQQSNLSGKCIQKIMTHTVGLKAALPLSWSSIIMVNQHPDHINTLQFLISGPKDTPYYNGLFLFDAFFTDNFPNEPPKVWLITTGGGSVRFNPNLYDCGKVCLSLLGTWSGSDSEKWNPKTSTFLQVLIAIQAQIFIDEPYFNEPGYERTRNTLQGNENNRKYNENIKLRTIQWGILNNIQNPPNGFEKAIKTFYKYKKEEIIEQMNLWEKDMVKNNYISLFKDCKEKIAKLLNDEDSFNIKSLMKGFDESNSESTSTPEIKNIKYPAKKVFYKSKLNSLINSVFSSSTSDKSSDISPNKINNSGSSSDVSPNKINNSETSSDNSFDNSLNDNHIINSEADTTDSDMDVD